MGEFYTELYDTEQSTIIHIDPKEVPEITSWEIWRMGQQRATTI